MFEDELIAFQYGLHDTIQIRNDSTEVKDAKAKMQSVYGKLSKAIRRVINDDLSEGKDYSIVGKDYAFTEQQARRFLRTSRKLHKYCLRQMQTLENTEEFKTYFDQKTDQLNKARKKVFAEYIAERNKTNFYEKAAPWQWLGYTKDDLIMKTLLSALFENDVDVMLVRLGIDAQSFRKDFDFMEGLVDEEDDAMPYQYGDPEATPPRNQSYAYYHYKVMRPLIYYRKWDDE